MAIEEDPPVGVPEWVVTFGDMMALLLTFFIMLVSMSEIKEHERYQAMVESLREELGHDKSLLSLIPGQIRPRNSTFQEHVRQMGRAKRKDTAKGGQDVKAVVGENERVQTIRPGEESACGGVVHFDEYQTELTEQNKRDLDRILPMIAGKPHKIEVRGHTTRRPVSDDSKFRDLYDVAFERCRATRDYLVAQGIKPERIRLGVIGGSEPAYDGVDPEQIKRNSRVQVLLWDERVWTPAAPDLPSMPAASASAS